MTFYIALRPGPYSLGRKDKGQLWIGENAIDCMERADVVKDIRDGQIDPPPVRVLEIDEEAGTVKDVTAAIAEEVGDLTFGDNKPPFAGLDDWLDHYKAGYYGWQAEG